MISRNSAAAASVRRCSSSGGRSGAEMYRFPGFRAVTTADFNGDSKLDLAIANNGFNSGNTVSILLGKGDGTFANHVDYATDQVPVWVALADFNGDHKPDLAVATNRGASVLLGNGDGTFQTHSDYNLQVVGGTWPPRMLT